MYRLKIGGNGEKMTLLSREAEALVVPIVERSVALSGIPGERRLSRPRTIKACWFSDLEVIGWW